LQRKCPLLAQSGHEAGPFQRPNPLKITRRRSSLAVSKKTNDARLTRERDEALEQLAATSEALKVVSRSTFDLQAVLDALIAAATRLCGADMGILRRRVGEVYELAATYGVKSEWGKVIAHHPNLPGGHSIMARAAASGQTVQVADVLQDPEYVNTATQKLIGLFTAPGFGDWFRERCNEACYPRIVPLAACGRPPAGACQRLGAVQTSLPRSAATRPPPRGRQIHQGSRSGAHGARWHGG